MMIRKAVLLLLMIPLLVSFAVLLGTPVSLNAESEKTSPQMCEKRMNVSVGSQQFAIPYCRSRALSDGHSTALRAVIVIQSSSLNTGDCYQWMWETVGRANKQNITVVYAPQFPVYKDIAAHNLQNNVPVWEDSEWAVGGDSLKLSGARATQISSFEVIDKLIKAFYDRQKFPRLQHVVVVGQSAGGQFVNRYAITNGIHEEAARKGLRMRYVVMNPSHYLYLDNKRPSPVDTILRVPNAMTIFALNNYLPAAEHHDANSANCKNYNHYPKGLESLWSYPARRTLSTIKNNYKTRDARYLAGALDKERNSAGLSKKCSSDLQGFVRLTRANLYWKHLKDIYTNDISRYQRIVIVPGIGHGSENMFKHPKGGMEHVLDYVP
jgi:hypothetical protein